MKDIKGLELSSLMGYKFLDHKADVKFRAFGDSVEDMFVSAMEAMNETIRGDIKILEQEERCFDVEGLDLSGLLYNFLEEFLVMLDRDDFLVGGVKEIEIVGNRLRCVVAGDKGENYKFTNDVKAVTYSEMYVEEKGGKWECQVVLDV